MAHPILLHVGYGRTATTAFQAAVFPQIPGVTYFDRLAPLRMYTRTGRRTHLQALLTELAGAEAADRPMFFTDEGLLHFDCLWQVARIREVLPQAHILLTLRSQPDLLLSLYRKRVTYGDETRGLERYLFMERYRLIGWLSYVERVRYLREVFDGRVTVCFFEEYTRDLRPFLGQLCDVLDLALDESAVAALTERAEAALAGLSAHERNPSLATLFDPVRVLNRSGLGLRLKRHLPTQLLRLDGAAHARLQTADRRRKAAQR